MRPEIAPKHIRVKDGPEVATTRSFGGVGAVLYAGAVSRSYAIGDSGAVLDPVTFTSLDADYLVRLQYTARSFLGNSLINLRFALDLDAGSSASSSSYSNYGVGFENSWSQDGAATVFISGTTIIPAGTHTVTPWYNNNLTTHQSAVGDQEFTRLSESWVVEILDKVSNEAFNVNYAGNNLGESFVWTPFSV